MARTRCRAGATSKLGRKASPLPADLQEAVTDLEECPATAAEHEYDAPTPLAMTTAESLLRVVYGIAPLPYQVYPMPDGDIAIDTVDGHGGSVIVFANPDGTVTVMVNSSGGHRHKKYDDASNLPDTFVAETLRELAANA